MLVWFFCIISFTASGKFHKWKSIKIGGISLSLLLSCATHLAGILCYCWCERAAALGRVLIWPMAKMETGFNTLINENDNLEHPDNFFSQQGPPGWVKSKLFWLLILFEVFFFTFTLKFWQNNWVEMVKKKSNRTTAGCAQCIICLVWLFLTI